jgi:hypothetical protein
VEAGVKDRGSHKCFEQVHVPGLVGDTAEAARELERESQTRGTGLCQQVEDQSKDMDHAIEINDLRPKSQRVRGELRFEESQGGRNH